MSPIPIPMSINGPPSPPGSVPATSTIIPDLFLLDAREMGKSGNLAGLRTMVGKCSNPAQAFAMVAAFFAGQEEKKMDNKLKEYEAQHNKYKQCLTYSRQAHEGKGKTSTKKYPTSTQAFNNYISQITGKRFKDFDPGNDSKHSKDEWQTFIDVINQQKDIESTDLNKLSTEMDMAVKDASKAEEMAAGAVKKATELFSVQARVSGG